MSDSFVRKTKTGSIIVNKEVDTDLEKGVTTITIKGPAELAFNVDGGGGIASLWKNMTTPDWYLTIFQ
ncbi:hypothetical protein CASFOL_021855 [Castilleja foliolosa]|uniref:Uncharacterized protein n=1 Tax=Castilleja foliolosa TaxID=1961234 RepID=A0ABD3CZT8_9LAMI